LRKTKIVSTLGPVSNSEEMIRKLISAGVNVFRLNTSHGVPEDHIPVIERIKKIRKELGISIGILLDLEGPKIRTGKFCQDNVELKTGQEFILTSEEITGDEKRVSINYPLLPKEVKPRDTILVYDGLIALKVIETDGTNIKTRVMNGGTLSHRKGINVPGVDISLPALTEKDKKYIKIGVEYEVDFFAQSFVRKPEDIDFCRTEMTKYNGKIPIIAKIETKQALSYLRSIIFKADGIMVARGDLGVEIPTEDVPVFQKRMIKLSNEMSKPVITATQMLESMIENPRPTRAEASDIANAIIDGTDAIMLSAETTIGKYPVESVKVMNDIALNIEANIDDLKVTNLFGEKINSNFVQSEEDAIAHACCEMSEQLGIKVIITSTVSGNTAKRVSRFRPNALLIGTTPSDETYLRLSLVYGVYPVLISLTNSTDEMIEKSVNKIIDSGMVKRGENVLITAGIPWGKEGTTNMIKIHRC